MKHYALGWACNLNNIFVRFPYEKCQSLKKLLKVKQKSIVKQVMREGINQVLNDIIENNATFQLPHIGYLNGEMRLEAVKDDDFIKAKQAGKFKGVDFLESFFTGYQMNLYISGKRDNFLHAKKHHVYFGKIHKEKLIENTNKGKQYC